MDTIEICKICIVVFYQKQEFCKKGIQPEACNFIEKETLAQVFSCEFCKTSTNNISYKTPPVTASVLSQLALVVRKYLRIQCKVISLENKINYFLLTTWNHLKICNTILSRRSLRRTDMTDGKENAGNETYYNKESHWL